MPDQTAPDQTAQDPRRPDWPLADLREAAEAHWDDAARLRLLLRDLQDHPDPAARELLARVTARLREVEPARPRVIRRDPSAFARVKAGPLPQVPTPEMAALLRQLQSERASGEQARQEAASLRRRLSESRAPEPDEALKRDLEAARAEARAAREEARKLAERLAFVRFPAGRARPEDVPSRTNPPRPDGRPRPDPAYAELGLSPDMPDELIPVLERALMRHHHPDCAAPEAREAATQRFQSVTTAFQRIRKLRGL